MKYYLTLQTEENGKVKIISAKQHDRLIDAMIESAQLSQATMLDVGVYMIKRGMKFDEKNQTWLYPAKVIGVVNAFGYPKQLNPDDEEFKETLEIIETIERAIDQKFNEFVDGLTIGKVDEMR